MRDIKLEGFEADVGRGIIVSQKFNAKLEDIAIDQEGNAYVAVSEEGNTLGLASYDAAGKFRFARGADCDIMEAALPGRVLQRGVAYDVPLRVESTRDKGFVPPSQLAEAGERTAYTFAAFIRDIQSGSWMPVDFRKTASDSYTLTLPSTGGGGGVCTLRITSAREAEPFGYNALQNDFLIAVPSSTEAGSITIVSDRNRTEWCCGDDVACYAIVRSSDAAGQVPLVVSVARGSDDPAIVRTVAAGIAAAGNTISLVIPGEATAQLAPGDHTVSVRESTAANDRPAPFEPASWQFHLASDVRPTSFQIVNFPEINARGGGTEEELAARGFNGQICLLDWLSEGQSSPIKDADRMEPVMAADPRMPPPEIFCTPTVLERNLASATRCGIDTRPILIFNETSVPYLPEMWPEQQREVQNTTQLGSRYRGFAGWCFTGHAHIDSFAEREKGKKMIETARQDFAKKAGGAPDEKKREWLDYCNHLIPDTLAAWQKAALEVNPQIENTVSPGEFVSSANGKHPPFMYEPFRLAFTHNQEEQWHERTVFPFMTDYARRPGKPLVSLHSMIQEAGNGQYLGKNRDRLLFFPASTRPASSGSKNSCLSLFFRRK